MEKIQSIEENSNESYIFKPINIRYVVKTPEAVKKFFEVKDFLKLDKNTSVFTFLLNEKYQSIHYLKVVSENNDSTNE